MHNDVDDGSVKGFLNLLCSTMNSEEMTAICRLNSETYGIISAVKLVFSCRT